MGLTCFAGFSQYFIGSLGELGPLCFAMFTFFTKASPFLPKPKYEFEMGSLTASELDNYIHENKLTLTILNSLGRIFTNNLPFLFSFCKNTKKSRLIDSYNFRFLNQFEALQ